MALFFHVIELEDGGWDCSQGRVHFDHHDEYDDALAHISQLAAENAPADVIVHRRGEPPATVLTIR